MNCYYGGFKKKNNGICNFLFSDLGLLHRNVIKDETDILVIDFLSLFLLFEFIVLNPEVFKGVTCFDIYGSNPDVILCLKDKKRYPRVESYRNAIVPFINRNSNMKFQFYNVPKKKNLSFFSIDVFGVDLEADRKSVV